MPQRRLIIDILTLARAAGHADGIVRTLREIASFAAVERDDVVFALFDIEIGMLRAINPEWIGAILDGTAKIETSHFPDRWGSKPRLRESFPGPLKQLAKWIQRPRRQLYVAIERMRLKHPAIATAARLDHVQRAIMSEKYRRELTDRSGGRPTLIPYEMAVQNAFEFKPTDVLLFAGSDWLAMRDQVSAFQGGPSPRLAVLCYDIIPLMFPQFFVAKNVEIFRACFETLFGVADIVVFTAKRIEADCRAYCEAHHLTLGKTAVVGLGSDFDPVAISPDANLPAQLERDRYALFVSTLEPRKGHRLLFSVWKRLLASGIPQAHRFKLVFVGRRGWLVDELLAELDAHPSVGDTLLLMSDVDDSMLETLYLDTAFCLYPSIYEGFGLPIIEGFRYGKAVIASNGGALAETVGDLSPCLDPLDEQAWYDTLKHWIETPAARTNYEAAIRERFRARSWPEAASELFALIDRELP